MVARPSTAKAIPIGSSLRAFEERQAERKDAKADHDRGQNERLSQRIRHFGRRHLSRFRQNRGGAVAETG